MRFFEPPIGRSKGYGLQPKYPKSWIVNIAAQIISIPIKARVLNLITPRQRARIVALGEALMGALTSLLKFLFLFSSVVTKRAQAESRYCWNRTSQAGRLNVCFVQITDIAQQAASVAAGHVTPYKILSFQVVAIGSPLCTVPRCCSC